MLKQFTIKTVAAAVLALGLGWASSASAALIIQVKENAGPYVNLGSSVSGFLAGNFGTANFVGNASVQGVPLLPTPNISTTALEARTTATGINTLTIEITQTNLTSFAGILANTFTGNTLTSGGNYSLFTIQHFVDGANGAFGKTTLLTGASYNGVGSFSTGPNNTPIAFGAPFSETVVYTITTTGSGSISGTSQIINVPEPASLALFGAGLLGLALARRRTNRA